ncbi:hypothetical protein [Streptomyces hebeiensis]
MGESVSVRCPGCGVDHAFMASVYPCACGAPVAPPLARDIPAEPVTHRSWVDEWVVVRCTACGRHGHWPQPELGCPCGTVLRIPVRPVGSPQDWTDAGFAPGAEGVRGPGAVEDTGAVPDGRGTPDTSPGPGGPAPDHRPGPDHRPAPDRASERGGGSEAGGDSEPGGRRSAPELPSGGGPFTDRPTDRPQPRHPAHIPLPRTAASPRPSFRPPTIRTSEDAVTAAALYLRWLGFKSVVRAADEAGSGVDLRGTDVVAQVDPTTSPASLRSVECLWLNGLSASAVGVFFALAGYAEDARARADDLGLPLFVIDLTGAPQPVNGPADELVSAGA